MTNPWHTVLVFTAFWSVCWVVHGLIRPCTSWPPKGIEWLFHLVWLAVVVAVSTAIAHLVLRQI